MDAVGIYDSLPEALGQLPDVSNYRNYNKGTNAHVLDIQTGKIVSAWSIEWDDPKVMDTSGKWVVEDDLHDWYAEGGWHVKDEAVT